MLTSGLNMGDRRELATYRFSGTDYSTSETLTPGAVKIPYEFRIYSVGTGMADNVTAGAFNVDPVVNGTTLGAYALTHDNTAPLRNGATYDWAETQTTFAAGSTFGAAIAGASGVAPTGKPITVDYYLQLLLWQPNDIN